MSSLLELAADFFDRMANPAHGAQVNEEYALRLAALLDGELESRLTEEARRLSDAQALTPHGWMWVLGWSKAHEVRLDDALLTALCEQWESSTFKAMVIENAIGFQHDNVEASAPAATFSIDDVDGTWLRELIRRAVQITPSDNDQPDPRQAEFPGNSRNASESIVRRHSRHAHSLLVALLLVDQYVTLNAASALLRHPWVGRPALLESFEARVMALDPESQSIWLQRLAPELEDELGLNPR
jgi:hypothetical protein